MNETLQDPEIFEAIAHEKKRQEENIELIEKRFVIF